MVFSTKVSFTSDRKRLADSKDPLRNKSSSVIDRRSTRLETPSVPIESAQRPDKDSATHTQTITGK